MAEHQPVTLSDPSSSVTATYVPAAGMICTSLADGGVEFLGQRRGVEAYITSGKTMGIPLLYPWANRLSSSKYAIDGGVVTLTPGVAGVRTDENGVPIHGVLGAYPGWVVTERSDNTLVAEVDWTDKPRLLATFPFPHVLTMSVTLADRTLTVETTVTPSAAAPVPLCYGYHPYLQIPDVARAQWQLQSPTMRHLRVDAWGLPTGATEEWAGGTAPLGDRELDHGFDQVGDGALFVLAGGDRRVEVTFEKGYPAAQLFAPSADDLVAVEPMAAPTDALRRENYRVAAPGEPDTSRFTIRVT
ncbi:aldose 1-epimerase [Mycolicibacterium monacense]|uniref:Aldose 1-epimerase n=1 Tax=Mycolicibacterium monacense TaxID=85693 RepID=A0AAD1IXV1_MYCMB|nr:aldose 1-epimerase [Mycolicibacterium monacense]MDA4100017.1 aldose 1-epimerase [Mycolicibacterium monacense DSM 44395]ORB20219.1 aldose epimerase [Mycolicibacterium monacense DSM 44395]QHP84321.1 aldose 1-epimerase [Mycolicibacterium monacense DSM 44395]BBZ62929.1 aldose 1-epimerase [Mycolicibacterium monacense]